MHEGGLILTNSNCVQFSFTKTELDWLCCLVSTLWSKSKPQANMRLTWDWDLGIPSSPPPLWRFGTACF